MTEPWVSVDDVAGHLVVAKDSFYRWTEKKGLPACRVGRLCKLGTSGVGLVAQITWAGRTRGSR